MLSHTDLDFDMQRRLISIGLCIQDCKSLCAAGSICATLVDIQTDAQTDT